MSLWAARPGRYGPGSGWSRVLLGLTLAVALFDPGCAVDSTRATARGALQRREFGERTGSAVATIADLGGVFRDEVSDRSARIGRRLRRAGENTADDASSTWGWVTRGAVSGLSDRSRRFARAVSAHWSDFWADAQRDAELFFARAWEDLKILE